MTLNNYWQYIFRPQGEGRARLKKPFYRQQNFHTTRLELNLYYSQHVETTHRYLSNTSGLSQQDGAARTDTGPIAKKKIPTDNEEKLRQATPNRSFRCTPRWQYSSPKMLWRKGSKAAQFDPSISPRHVGNKKSWRPWPTWGQSAPWKWMLSWTYFCFTPEVLKTNPRRVYCS